MRTTGTVDDWFEEQQAWHDEVAALRALVLGCGLSETLKWRQPCYVDNGDNVVMIGTLKDCCTLSFLKGALVEDPTGLLIAPGENSRSARYVRFESLAEIEARRPEVEALVHRAVQVARAGLRVARPEGELELVEELQARLDADPALKAAFEGLTPGRQRAYNILVSGAKTASGRESRISRFTERILMGKGPNDCICGHSKRPPGCDGSHKLYS